MHGEKDGWEIGWTLISVCCVFINVCNEEFYIPKTTAAFFQVIAATHACATGI